jgi:outer membrane protein assembly factor BamB
VILPLGGSNQGVVAFKRRRTHRTRGLVANNRLRVHFGAAIRVGNLVIGSSGDFGPAFLVALNTETGEEVRTFARAQIVNAGGTLVVVDEDGEIALASATEAGLRVHARKELLASNAWTPPTVVNGRLYVRDRQQVLALQLSE